MNVAAILKDKGDNVVTVSEGITLDEAAGVLQKHRIGAVVVKGPSGEPAGVLSERDIVSQIAANGVSALAQPVSACMTCDVVTVGMEDSVDDLMSLMTKKRIRHLPVVNDGSLCGLVSIGDVVKRKIAEAEAEAEAMKNYIASA